MVHPDKKGGARGIEASAKLDKVNVECAFIFHLHQAFEKVLACIVSRERGSQSSS